MPNRGAGARRVTVLDLRDSPWVDGPGRTILDCATSLRDIGYDLIVGTFSGGHQKTNAYAEEATKRGLPVRTLQERWSLDHRVVSQLVALIDEVGADIIHAHDFRSNMFGLLAARIRRRPVVTTVHGWIANDQKGRIYVSADKAILRFFDRIIAVSDCTRGLVEKAWISGSKISVIPNALILDCYIPDRGADAFRREIGAGPETRLIANIGRLSPEKGQLEFLSAARTLVGQGVDAKFILIGIGPDQEKLEKFVAANQLDAHVIFVGFRKDMTSIYNSLDLVVQSSYTEGMPNVILEALLMEVPVIATDVGGTAEVLKHGETGLLVQPGDVNGMAERMSNFCSEPETLRSMARRGRLDISNRYDHNQRVQRLAALYDSLFKEGR